MELSFSSNSRKINLKHVLILQEYKVTSSCGGIEIMRLSLIPDTTTYEIMTAGNAENSKSKTLMATLCIVQCLWQAS